MKAIQSLIHSSHVYSLPSSSLKKFQFTTQAKSSQTGPTKFTSVLVGVAGPHFLQPLSSARSPSSPTLAAFLTREGDSRGSGQQLQLLRGFPGHSSRPAPLLSYVVSSSQAASLPRTDHLLPQLFPAPGCTEPHKGQFSLSSALLALQTQIIFLKEHQINLR